MTSNKTRVESGRMKMAAAVLAAISIQPAWTQIVPPTGGFVADAASHTIRPVIGFAGAWTLGSSIDLGIPVTGAQFAVNRDFALIATDTGVSVLSSASRGASALVQIPGAAAADRIELNTSENAALLYSTALRQIQWIRGLPDQPLVAKTVSLADLSGDLTAMALNRRGGLALIGRGGLLYRVTIEDSPRAIGSVNANSIAFAANDHDAFIADSQAGQVLIAKGSQGLSLVADASAGVNAPSSLQVVGEANLLISSAAASKVQCLDVNQGTLSETALPFAALRMDRFGPNMFLLNQIGDGPLYILDASSSANNAGCSPSLLFIPADQPKTGDSTV